MLKNNVRYLSLSCDIVFRLSSARLLVNHLEEMASSKECLSAFAAVASKVVARPFNKLRLMEKKKKKN